MSRRLLIAIPLFVCCVLGLLLAVVGAVLGWAADACNWLADRLGDFVEGMPV